MRLTSLANPLVKDFAKLAEKKYRAESGLFWLEGAEYVARAAAAGWEMDNLVCEEESWIPAYAGMTPRGGVMVNKTVLSKITGKTNPQPVLGVLKQRWHPLPSQPQGLWLALDRVRDPGNLGTILRTADAVGAAGCILIGESTDPYSPECVRATVGSILHVPLVRCTEAEFVDWAKGKHVIGTHLNGAVDYRTLKPQGPCVLLMGNESAGLTDALAASCTQLAKIPMVGHTESLNLATSTALMLYELRRADL
ncbi:MAG: RNA methyltransferase [Alphaproteobacteria bacterium]